MINVGKRIILLIENYKKEKNYSFEKYGCVERATLKKVAMISLIPYSQVEDLISLMKGFNILSEFQTTQNWAGYIFNKENFEEFKKGFDNGKDRN